MSEDLSSVVSLLGRVDDSLEKIASQTAHVDFILNNIDNRLIGTDIGRIERDVSHMNPVLDRICDDLNEVKYVITSEKEKEPVQSTVQFPESRGYAGWLAAILVILVLHVIHHW
jgi:hypothetical protein